jgi:hypothetical protein
MKEFKVGYCLTPKDLSILPTLGATPTFIAPNQVDCRDLCTISEDQGTTSKCAAYTASQYAENIRWRLDGFPTAIDMNQIYDYAKSVDGMDGGDGTTLPAVAKALINFKHLPGTEENIKVIGKNLNDIKYAMHKYGVVMCAFNITEEWFSLNQSNPVLYDFTPHKTVGGHAVLGCGYNNDGIFIQNSWGSKWGSYGFALIPWNKAEQQFIYGCTITNILNNLN